MSLKQDEATIAFDVGLKSGKQTFKDKTIEILEKQVKKKKDSEHENGLLEAISIIKNITI